MSLFVAKKIHDGSEPESPKSDGSSALPVDVYRYQQKLVIIAPIAGISIDDISVAITEDILTIKGEREHPDNISANDFFSEECFWGSFHRSIVLPVEVDTEQVAAFYKRGILRIELPLLEEKTTRVIPVKITEE